MPKFSYLIYLRLLVVLVLLAGYKPQLEGQSTTLESEVKLAHRYLDSIEVYKGDFAKQLQFAKRAADIARKNKQSQLLLKSQLLALAAADYFADTLTFNPSFQEVLEVAQELKDTAALIRAYFTKGMISFTVGNYEQGILAFKEVLRKEWFNKEGLKDYISILGALADLSMDFERNVDSTIYYVQNLQLVAERFDDPAAYMVASTKMSYLYSKSNKHDRSVEQLRKAYKYQEQVENKGYLFYFYRRLINSFIELNQIDSAQYYLLKCKQFADFSQGDPRHCSVVMMEAQVNQKLGVANIFSADFNHCYDYYSEDKAYSTATIRCLQIAAEAYFQMGKLKRAEEETDSVIAKSSSVKNEMGLLKAYELLYRIHQQSGRPKEALDAHIQFKHYSDIVNRATFEQGESLLETQAALRIQRKQNDILTKENELAGYKIQRRNLLIAASLVITLLSIIILAMLVQMRHRRKEETRILEQKVKQRTIDLEESKNTLLKVNKELLESNEELERFAHLASHDMREPLRNIMNFSKLLSKTLSVKKPEIQEYLKFIMQGASDMYRLIEDILEFSSIRKSENRFEALEVEALLANLTQNLESLIQEKNVQFQFNNLSNVVADKSQLKAIFQNLIINGIKYNDSSAPLIKITQTENENYYFLAVEDNGIGIDPKFQQKVFELFRRLHARSEYEGTGIGLPIVKKMVEGHGGAVFLESELGLGTKVTFSISKALKQEGALNTGTQKPQVGISELSPSISDS